MNVRLNEFALTALLDSSQGPVGIDMHRRAFLGRLAMQAVMTEIIPSIPRDQIEFFTTESPLSAFIGLVPGLNGSTTWGQYFLSKNVREPGRISNQVLAAAGFVI